MKLQASDLEISDTKNFFFFSILDTVPVPDKIPDKIN